MIDLRSLEVFFWVVKLGGFGRAGERLHMTQPAVSARISQIESRLRVKLLDRAPHRPAAPTAKGLELYAYAERMLSLQSELLVRLAGGAELSGIVRLGTAETLVHTMLGALLRALHAAHPRLVPEITVDISPNLRAGLLAGELDVALLLGPVTDPAIRNVALRDYELAWVASPALGLGSGRLGLADLARWPILSYARGTLPYAQLAELFGRADLPPVRLFANSSLASIVRMAVDEIGIGIVPLAVAARELEEGRLRRLEVEPVMPDLRFTASYFRTPGSEVAETVATLAGQVAAAS